MSGDDGSGAVAVPMRMVSSRQLRSMLNTSGTLWRRWLFEELARESGVKLYDNGVSLMIAEEDIDKILKAFGDRYPKTLPAATPGIEKGRKPRRINNASVAATALGKRLKSRRP